MSVLIATPSQTVGPYFRLGLDALNQAYVAAPGAADLIGVSGQVTDGDGIPITDCVVEVWQADSAGQYASLEGVRNPSAEPDWSGFARVPTDEEGRFSFHTVKPGLVDDGQGGLQAPHALVMVGMRGLLRFLMTRMYFPDASIEQDRVLQLVPAMRRHTLVATEVGDRQLKWDIRAQGADETVFFDY